MIPDTLEVCKLDLFSPKEELEARYPAVTVERVMRIRDMYQWMLSNPSAPPKEFVDEVRYRYKISSPVAYDDLKIVKALLPLITEASKDFHRWRYNEMILETYKMAKSRKDTKTMEKAASSYAKYNSVDEQEDKNLPYEMIVPQPFMATDDPRVLGIEPIPNIKERISKMIKKYRAESIDIDDVDFEEADLEEDSLFSETNEK